MKKHLLFLSLILSVMFPVSAETFRADGLRYEIISSSSRTVRVTYESSIASSNKDYVSGDLSIPAEVARRVNGLNYTYSVVSIGKSAFSGCTGLTSVTLPDNITLIDDFAFKDCSELTTINIPNGVTSIGTSAFYGSTGLTSVSIPQNVTKINEKAFYDCTQLTKVYSLNPQPPTLWYNSFSDETYNNTILTVPQGCKSLYRDKEIGKKLAQVP